MKFKTQKILGALVVCGCLAALRTQAAFEYDFVPDSPAPGVSGSIFLNESSNPTPDGTISDIFSLNITFNGVSYTKGDILSVGTFFEWDPTTINTMSLQLNGSKGTLSVTDTTINGGGVTRLTAGSWNAASSVPDAANTSLLFIIALGSLGVWHWLRRSRSVTVS